MQQALKSSEIYFYIEIKIYFPVKKIMKILFHLTIWFDKKSDYNN